MRYWAFGSLCTFALTVSNLAAPALGGRGLVVTGTGLRPANEQDDLMSATADHSPSLPASGTLGMRIAGRVGLRTLTAIRAWRARMRLRRELLMLNDVELRELSLTKADVDREAHRPFWEGVQLTNR
jgi:uncharacterized protein YjiS (DUF1127 family)